MTLRPEISLPVALATGTAVYGIYALHVPNQADVRAHGRLGDDTVDSARKQALWTSAALVSGISLVAKDPTIFIVGGGLIVVVDWLVRSNNWTNPLTGRVDVNPFTVERPSDMGPEPEPAPSNNGAEAYAVS